MHIYIFSFFLFSLHAAFTSFFLLLVFFQEVLEHDWQKYPVKTIYLVTCTYLYVPNDDKLSTFSARYPIVGRGIPHAMEVHFIEFILILDKIIFCPVWVEFLQILN